MRVLVACEFSGRVRDAFTAMGHDAVSCDYEEALTPGLHYQRDALEMLDWGFDLMIAHPPCTYLTCSAEWAYATTPMINGVPRKLAPGTLVGRARAEARRAALEFVSRLWAAPIEKICIENPVGVIPRFMNMPKPQYIQPYMFGEDASKRTGLWLKGLPRLEVTKPVLPREVRSNGRIRYRWGNQTDSGQNKESPSPDRWKSRSITPKGVAEAMASQWGGK